MSAGLSSPGDTADRNTTEYQRKSSAFLQTDPFPEQQRTQQDTGHRNDEIDL